MSPELPRVSSAGSAVLCLTDLSLPSSSSSFMASAAERLEGVASEAGALAPPAGIGTTAGLGWALAAGILGAGADGLGAAGLLALLLGGVVGLGPDAVALLGPGRLEAWAEA